METKVGIQLDLVKITESYNSDYISCLVAEECAELIQALSKIKRQDFGEYRDKNIELKEHLCEEIADVELTLQVLKSKLCCENKVYDWKRKKVRRWKQRLGL